MQKFWIALILLTMSSCGHLATAQEEHVHGVNVPDWYDPACCNLRDCRPIPVDPADEQPVAFVAPESKAYNPEDDETWIVPAGPAYRWHGLVFLKWQFRVSQDERFHVCVQNTTTYCIYLPFGV